MRTIEASVLSPNFPIYRTRVETNSPILSIGHNDTHGGILHVEFRNGRVYEHCQVTPGEYRSLLKDPTFEHYRDMICGFYPGTLISSVARGSGGDI